MSSILGGGAGGVLRSEPANTMLGNNTANPSTPLALSPAQITAMLNDFTSSLQGLVPASGGGTTSFLRADGSWVAPGGSGAPGGANTDVQYNNSGAFGGDALMQYVNSALLLSSLNSGPGGLAVTTNDPRLGNDPTSRRAVQIAAYYNIIDSALGFTDQGALNVYLFFGAGINQYGAVGGINAKFTPIALNVYGDYYGSGEKFVATWTGNMYSMGDSFLWSADLVYCGGPIQGDEGQGFTPAFFLAQPNGTMTDTITTVTRTAYSTTITGTVTGSQTAQDIPVASTVGANVNDWVIINQAIMASGTNLCAMQILSINPGVSIHGVCTVNAVNGSTIKPALCLNLASGGFGFGEGRVLIDYSGASYSTGVVASVSGGGFTGSGTTWTNAMVGGDALNIGSVWLTVDDLTSSPFSVGTPLHSVYQITQVASATSIAIFSFSVAGDAAYHGNGVPPAANMAYKIVPSARIMKWHPLGGGFNLICEYSAHTWTVGDTVECVICPYPDVHGFDFRVGEWTAGGVRRYALSFINDGARMFQAGISLSTLGGIGSNADFDPLAWSVGFSVSSCQLGLQINNTSSAVTGGILINSTGADVGTKIALTSASSGASIVLNSANFGTDLQLIGTGAGGLLRSISSIVNADGSASQLLWNGYLQLTGVGSIGNFIRFGGGNLAGSSIDATFDINYVVNPSRTLQFRINQPLLSPTVLNPFSISLNGVQLGPQGVATSNTTNQPSFPFQFNASVWNAAAAHNFFAQLEAIVGSGIDDAPITLQLSIWDNVNNNASFPNIPFEVRTDGLLKFGFNNQGFSSDKRVTLDAITKVTAARTVTFLDTAGDVVVAAANTTGAGSALLGANSPAITNTAPYTWLRMLSHDGSTVYVPAWK